MDGKDSRCRNRASIFPRSIDLLTSNPNDARSANDLMTFLIRFPVPFSYFTFEFYGRCPLLFDNGDSGRAQAVNV